MLPLLTIAVVAALAFANGANDVSKGVAPLVGSAVTGYRTAIAWGTAWTIVGAVLGAIFAAAMLSTFGTGLLSRGMTPGLGGAFAALFGATAWVALATRTSLPVSTTHAIVGAIIGATVAAHGVESIRWSALGGKVVVPLLVSPIVAFVLTAGLARAFRARAGSDASGIDCVCAEISSVVAVPARPDQAAVLARPLGLQVSAGTAAECAIHRPAAARVTLGQAQWLTSAATSLARGMNDAPKMVALGLSAAALAATGGVPVRALYLAVAAGMAAGGLAAGRRVTHLLAEKVTALDTASGLTANGVTALLVTAGAVYGLPMSTTHVASGGIAGVGAVRGSVNWSTVRQMSLAWVVTLPASAVLAGLGEVLARALGA